MRVEDGAVPGPASAAHTGRRLVQRLLDRGTRRRVCLVIGAAGWGKTAAVTGWAAGIRAATVRPDADDPAAARLLADLHTAVRPHLPSSAANDPPSGRAREGGGPEAGALCRWLRRHLSEDLVLVVDDVHELRPDGDAARLVEGLCRHAPDRLHIVLVSRREPPFSLRRLRGQGLVAEIVAPELALDVTDVATILETMLGETRPALSMGLWEQTAGWPAVVQLAVEQLRGIDPAQRLTALGHLTSPGERLHDYLAEEVVGREPESVQELLRRLAVCGETGSATGFDDEAVLGDLTRRGLVRRSRHDGVRWSLVRPLRDYFGHRAVLSADHRKALHRAVAQDCLARDEPAGALRHLVAAGQYDESAALLREHGAAMVRDGELDAVLAATALPPAHLEDPSIQRVLGEARQVLGQFAAAEEGFRRAGHDGAVADVALAWRMAQVAFTRGRFDAVQGIRRATALDDEPAHDARMRALEAATCRLTGDLAGVHGATTQAMAAARRCDDPAVWAAVHAALALQSAAEGDRRRADEHWADALGNASAADDDPQRALIHAGQAAHLLEFGRPQAAFTEAQTALRIGERHGHLFLVAHSLTTRGRAQARLGALDSAVDDLARAVELFQRMGSAFVAWPLCGLADVHRLRGQLARARAMYEEALGIAEPGHDVLGIGAALTGLARVRAADDAAAARALAERAVALHDGLREVSAVLARGWVALQAGDRRTAASDAARAGEAARQRRDDLGLAEALVLGALTSEDPGSDAALFAEAIEIWREAGCGPEEATARVAIARVGGPLADLGAELARRRLDELGVDLSGRDAGPLGAVRARAPSVSIRTLGAFQVIRDGGPVPKTAWQSKKARDLLKMLVTRRRPVPREQLTELLWPGTDGARSGNRLSVLLSMARDVLQPEREGDGPLASDGSLVWLDRQHLTVDVEDFLDRAATALDAHAGRAPDATERLIAAEAGYTGSFLEDDPYHDWAQALTEEVRATHVALLRALTGRLRDAGDVNGVVRYTMRLLAHDDYDEQAHLDLVTVQLEAGRFGDARRHYRLYLKRMKEIRVDPRPMPSIGRRPDHRTDRR